MRRKGIEPIVSVVLLLLITIALAGGVLVWLTGYVGGFQDDIAVKTTSCSRNETAINFRVYLLNTGQSQINPKDLSYNFLSGPSDLVNVDTDTVDQISPGSQALIKVQGYNTTTGIHPRSGTYVFEIVSSKSVAKAVANCA